MTGSLAVPGDRAGMGIGLIVLAVFLMSIQESLFKLFSAELSLWQIFTLRGLIAVPLLALLAALGSRHAAIWREATRPAVLARSFIMTLMFLAMYAAIPVLDLSTAAAGIYTAPLFVVLMSSYLLREPVSARGWFAVAIGFTGVLLVLQPGADAFTAWAILPLFGGFCYALANVTTRRHCRDLSPASLSLSLNVALLLTGVALTLLVLAWRASAEWLATYPYLFDVWSPIGKREWVLIVCLAILVVVIGMALAAAYQRAPAARIAAFDYSYLVFVAIWDIVIFETIPDLLTMGGIGLIVAAGFLAVRAR